MKNQFTFYSLCAIAILCLNINSLHAQATSSKKLQAGMTANFGLNFQKMGSNKMTNDGVGTGLSIGMILHTSFKNSNNLGLATGLEFDFETLNYKAGDSSVFYKYTDNKILGKDDEGGTAFQLSERQIKPVYVTIPLMLLFRTEPIGDWRYFGKFGIRNSFVVSQKINDIGVDVASPTTVKENTPMKSFGETFFYRGSIGFSAGAEWNFIGSTTLVPEIGFFYGLTPLHFRAIKDNYTLYDGANNYFFTKAKQNQLLLKVSILF